MGTAVEARPADAIWPAEIGFPPLHVDPPECRFAMRTCRSQADAPRFARATAISPPPPKEGHKLGGFDPPNWVAIVWGRPLEGVCSPLQS